MRGARLATTTAVLPDTGLLVTPEKVQQKLAPIGVRLCMIGAGECLTLIIRTLSGSLRGQRCLVSSGKN